MVRVIRGGRVMGRQMDDESGRSLQIYGRSRVDYPKVGLVWSRIDRLDSPTST